MQYIIHRDTSKKNELEQLLNNFQPTTPIITINKTKSNNITSFFTKAKLYLTFITKLKINSIELLDTKIKPYNNLKINNLVQHFNIRNSYIATIDKQVIEKITNFYKELEEIQIEPDQSLFFDVSHETNLQRALKIETITPSQNMEENTTPLPTTPVDNNQEISTLQSIKTVQPKKITGYINTIMLGIIAFALIIFVSITIGVKIMNMS